MSRKNALARISRSLESFQTANAEPAAELAPDETEPRQLAREVIRAFVDELAFYRRSLDPESKENERLDPKEPPSDSLIERVRRMPPQEVTFYDLERLSRLDPALMQERWQQVKDAARQDLASGWLAGRAIESLGGNAWQRACFLALRQQLRQAWRPRNDAELLLLDEMAQYELLRREWVGTLAMLSRNGATITSLGAKGYPDSTRKLSAAEATLEALRTVERLQRLYQNSLRALLSLRRVKTPVVVRSAGQVNVAAGPQMNLQCSHHASPDESSRGAR